LPGIIRGREDGRLPSNFRQRSTRRKYCRAPDRHAFKRRQTKSFGGRGERYTEGPFEERAEFARVPVDEKELVASYGFEGLAGEPGFTPRERQWGRPTLDFNGVWGGYQGAGAKTIIPGSANAKLSCRLVPDQDPAEVAEAIARHLEAVRPSTVRTSLTQIAGCSEPFLTPLEHPLNQAARRALRRVYGSEPAFVRSGGSIGAVLPLHRELGAPCLLVGFVLPDSRAHAPNERLDLDCFHLGRRAAASLWEEIAAITPSS